MTERVPLPFRHLFAVLAPDGPRSRLTILIFHRVLDRQDFLQPGEPTADEFDSQIRWLTSWFKVLPLSEAVEALRAGDLPERRLAITFDDGYPDNHDVAVPILRRHGAVATFFVATGYLDGGIMFNGRLASSLGVAERTRIFGNMPQDRLRRVCLAIDVLALGSRREGWPNVLLEAMACGTQVVATNVGGVPEIVADPQAGQVVSSQDLDAFVSAAARVREIAGEFGWDPVAQRYFDLIESAAGSRVAGA